MIYKIKIYLIMIMSALLINCSPIIEKLGTNIEIKIDAVEEISFQEDSKIKFILWGYDTSIIDQSATKLNEYVYTITKVPATFELEFKNEWNDTITPTSGNGEFGYYITLYVDKDNNGIIDNMDYRVDYDNTNEKFYASQKTSISELSSTVYITNLDNDATPGDF